MILITDEMKENVEVALADGYSCLLGSVSKGGEPQISPKGSVMVYDDDTLAYWERAKRSALPWPIGNGPSDRHYRMWAKIPTW